MTRFMWGLCGRRLVSSWLGWLDWLAGWGEAFGRQFWVMTHSLITECFALTIVDDRLWTFGGDREFCAGDLADAIHDGDELTVADAFVGLDHHAFVGVALEQSLHLWGELVEAGGGLVESEVAVGGDRHGHFRVTLACAGAGGGEVDGKSFRSAQDEAGHDKEGQEREDHVNHRHNVDLGG
jgi:hypothetical protein